MGRYYPVWTGKEEKMFEDFDLFFILLLGVSGFLGLNLLMNYQFLIIKLRRNIHYSNPWYIKVKKKTFKWILIIDLVILIMATISMIFDSRLFIILIITIYLITIFPAMGRMFIKAKKEVKGEMSK